MIGGGPITVVRRHVAVAKVVVIVIRLEFDRDGDARPGLLDDVEVQVRPGRASGRSDLADDVTAINPLAFADEHPVLPEMDVNALRAVLVQNLDDVSGSAAGAVHAVRSVPTTL